MPWPVKKAAKQITDDESSAIRTSRAVFAARMRPRCGVAASVARIRPLPYSFVTTSAPSTPKNRTPITRTLKLMSSGLNAALLRGIEMCATVA